MRFLRTQFIVAWMAIKDALDKKNGKRLYNLELIKIEKLAGNLGSIERP